jgi:hypothetical protein
MSKQIIAPFQNETDCIHIGELTVENRVDRISIYGSIDLTLDKAGLESALLLKKVIDLALAEMEKADLPDSISLEKAETVKNPFE